MANDVLTGATNQFNFPELPNSRIILSAEVYTRLLADINLCAFSGNKELEYGTFLYGKEIKPNIIYFDIPSKHDDYEPSFREFEVNTDKNGNELEMHKELIKILDKKKIKYYSCIKELNIDNNKLYFLQTKEYDNENDNSYVIYTELDGYKFVFMGDAGVEKEKEILNKYNISNIDVLKIGHHGSKTSSDKNFIDEMDPKYNVISVGKNNRYGHPNKEVLNNLSDSKIYRTDQDGSIMFKIKNDKLEIETCSP